MRLVFIGAPGAGKGTQAAHVCKACGLAHISTGDLLRAELEKDGELSKRIKSFIEKGELVPDDLMVQMVRERLQQEDARKGFLLDGFPRTVAQANELAKFIELDQVINIEVTKEHVAERIAKRRVCKDCATPFTEDEVLDSKCKNCGGETIQRPDDNYETVMHRLDVFEEQTAPLVDYYKKKGLLVDIDGDAPVEQVTESIFANLKKRAS